MNQHKERRDFYTGIPWVNVTPEQARGHPKGKMYLLLWAIVAYFLGVAVLRFVFLVPIGIGVATIGSVWPFLAGLGLAFRVPWSVVMAIISTASTAYSLVRGFGTDGSFIYLIETIANIGILFYLMDGDRPNLIYRHRYRKYSAEKGEDVNQG